MKQVFSKKDTNFIKGIAILIMMLHHCFLSQNRFEGFVISFYPFNQNFIVRIAQVGKCCVGIFTFLSVYGITCSFKKLDDNYNFSMEQVKLLTLKRILHLFSGFLIAYIFGFVSSCITGPTPLSRYKSWKTFLIYMLLDMLGLADIIGTPSLCGTWWYMGLAFAIILFIPIMLKFYKRLNWMVLPAYFILFCALGFTVTTYSRWLIFVPLGIVFADYNLLAKCKFWRMHSNNVLDYIGRFVLLTLFLCIMVYLQVWNYGKLNYLTLILDPLMTLSVILWCYVLLADIKIVYRVLVFIGKYSMNIFLIHTFIRLRWFNGQIYLLHHFMLIIFGLFSLSLLVSIALEAMKKYTKYNIVSEKIIQKLIG